jgi:thiol-disulfide isomerase/thioredoxin
MACAVEVGDAAPALKAKAWLQGEPLDPATVKDKLVVVEWFATWCADSQKAVARLNRLQRLYGEKLDIVAMTEEDEAAVRKFLATYPARYRVALDQGVASKKVWMQFVVVTPYAFIARDGKLVWTGSPERGLYPAVADLLAGRFDPQRYVKLNAIHFEMTHALKAHKTDEVLRLLDQMIATVPEDAWAYGLKLSIYRKQHASAEARETCIAMGKHCTSDPDALAEAAKLLATAGGLYLRDMPLALSFAQRAADLTKGQEAEALEVLARCHYELGHLAKAVETQQAALGVAAPADRPSVERTLTFLRAEQARRAADPDAK